MNGPKTDDQLNGAGQMIGVYQTMQSIRKAITHLAAYDIPVLIQGEPGTGKRSVARAIHAHGRRSHQVLRALRCSHDDSAAVERELFGCDRTGQEGLLAACHGGTLILEEIADLSLAAQSSLLLHMHGQARIARDGAYGANGYDVTLIFTTAHDIDQLVISRRVRSDLFYELSGSILSLPSSLSKPSTCTEDR